MKQWTKNHNKSTSTYPITVDATMAVGMRYLCGGNLNDIWHIFSMSYFACRKCSNNFIMAKLLTDGFKIVMPSAKEEWYKTHDSFQKN